MIQARDMATELGRGTARLLHRQGFATLAEAVLASGRRADLLALGPDGEIRIVEVKSSVADFRADKKWHEYRDFCDRLYFAVAAGFDDALIPAECGLIRADAWGAAILREAPVTPLSPARRRAVTLRFARLAWHRLARLVDPDAALGDALD
ncbi:MAG: MmcB family DNA repair protein [Stellaceae bacterium]